MRIFGVIITAAGIFLSLLNVPSASAEQNKYALLGQTTIVKERNNIVVQMVRLRPGVAALVLDIPPRYEAKINSVSLTSPSGKKCKSRSILPVEGSGLESYLDSMVYYRRSFWISEAYAEPACTAPCGGTPAQPAAPAQQSGSSQQGNSSQRSHSSGISAGQMLSLFSRAMSSATSWFTVSIFDIPEEDGAWDLVIKYFLDGKQERINVKLPLNFTEVAAVPPGTPMVGYGTIPNVGIQQGGSIDSMVNVGVQQGGSIDSMVNVGVQQGGSIDSMVNVGVQQGAPLGLNSMSPNVGVQQIPPQLDSMVNVGVQQGGSIDSMVNVGVQQGAPLGLDSMSPNVGVQQGAPLGLDSMSPNVGVQQGAPLGLDSMSPNVGYGNFNAP
ncbi:MAG: hypothetical protein V1727_01440 [Candidatus Omnitrophota bacterium]